MAVAGTPMDPTRAAPIGISVSDPDGTDLEIVQPTGGFAD